MAYKHNERQPKDKGVDLHKGEIGRNIVLKLSEEGYNLKEARMIINEADGYIRSIMYALSRKNDDIALREALKATKNYSSMGKSPDENTSSDSSTLG